MSTGNAGGPPQDEFEVKKAEELYKLARESYAAEDRRFDTAEAKISRYLSILFVVLGLSTFGARQIRITLAQEFDPFGVLLVLCIVGFYISSVIAFVHLVRAIRLQDIRALRLGTPVVDYFARFGYVETLVNLARAFLQAGSTIRTHVGDKYKLAAKGFTALLATVFFALVGSSSYLVLEIRESLKEPAAMSEPGKEQSQESTSTDTDSAAAEPAAEQQGSGATAAEAADALFETVQKGFEGGVERRDAGDD